MLCLAGRIDAVAGRVRQAIAASMLNVNMTRVTKALGQILGTMEPTKIAAVLDEFEAQNETLDTRMDFIGQQIDETTKGVTPEDEVTNLMAEMGEVVGMNLRDFLPDNLPREVTPPVQAESPEAARQNI